MKKILSHLLPALLLLAIPVGILLSWDLPQGPVYDETYYGQLSPMVQKAYETQDRKLLVLGSSSVAFGLHSALLEEELKKEGVDIRVCSFGLYGAIGTRAMMELSLGCLNEGDVVVLSPEFYEQSLSRYYSAEHLWYAMDQDRSLLFHLPAESQGSLVGNYIYFVRGKAKYVREETKAKPSGVYARASFDENGDMTQCERPANIMPLGYDVNNRIDLSPELFSEDFLAFLNEYCDELAERGVTVYYSYAPMNREGCLPFEEDELKALDLFLRENLHCMVISNPYDYILDAGWFYDSNFHLNESGMELRTIRLLNDLKNVWGITTRTELALPDMPALSLASASQAGDEGETPGGEEPGKEEPAGEDESGKGEAHGNGAVSDLADAVQENLFVYEEDGETLRITGVKEEARQERSLSLPSIHDGKPVTSFTAQAFQGLDNLEEVFLPASIRILHDGCFSGCAKLKRVVLRQENPAAIQVGYELLKGTEGCHLVVPSQDALSEYVNNYFWGFYADVLEADNLAL